MNASRVLDEYLLASIHAGDRKAFELFARRWQKKLLGHAWRLLGGDVEAARDAVQEGWIEIVNGLSRLRDDRAFPAWAFRIVSRRCARQIGAAVRERQLAAESTIAPGDQSSPETASDDERLRAAVRALPKDQRAAIALFHFEDMSIAEVAVALDVPAGTVKTRLMHARRKLRDALGGDE
ncbi:sigma-70 family RNA polymerase sigma factor [Sphingomonas sp.]|uniref:RNA polymerase sigma factor n=1 Tax=Sphingomonas sp. TaxID=28214 RepID=UPI0025FEA193|nr:sigma-70 family RNA polymerase sigma factor [Sphingomonas sp.]